MFSSAYTFDVSIIIEINAGSSAPGNKRSGLIFFLFLDKNLCCGYSSELPHRGNSDEYPQLRFLSRNK